MTKGFFPKLALGNIKKNGRIYVPYIVSSVITVAMYYIIKSLSINPGLNDMIGAEPMTYMLNLGTWVVAVFAVIFLFYTSSFIIKRRKKEFGLYNILGMEKLHIAVTMAWESLITSLIALGAGLILGIALDKVMYMFFLKILGVPVTLGFFVSAEAILGTLALFGVIFALIFLNQVRQVSVAKPVELLRAENAGEKEPKTKALMAVAGVICLGIGYYIALTTENPLMSFLLFFVAVLFVIAGTYLLFTAGSIAMLKALRKNKRFYYKPNHFISVSGMIYRMKQNAAGLANICILSTMVLVMISTTSAMMVGMNDTLDARYPRDLSLYSFYGISDEAIADVKALQKEKGISVKDELDYRYLSFSAVQEEDVFTVTESSGNIDLVGKVSGLVFVPLEDYNACTGGNDTLGDGEIMVYANRADYSYEEMTVGDEKFTVKKKVDEFMGNGITAANVANTYFVVTDDMAEIEKLYGYEKGIYGDAGSEIRHYYGFNTDASEEDQIDFYEEMSKIGLAESKAEDGSHNLLQADFGRLRGQRQIRDNAEGGPEPVGGEELHQVAGSDRILPASRDGGHTYGGGLPYTERPACRSQLHKRKAVPYRHGRVLSGFRSDVCDSLYLHVPDLLQDSEEVIKRGKIYKYVKQKFAVGQNVQFACGGPQLLFFHRTFIDI